MISPGRVLAVSGTLALAGSKPAVAMTALRSAQGAPVSAFGSIAFPCRYNCVFPAHSAIMIVLLVPSAIAGMAVLTLVCMIPLFEGVGRTTGGVWVDMR